MKSLCLIDGTNLLYRAYHAPFQNLDTRCPNCGWEENGEKPGEVRMLEGDFVKCSTCNGTGREPTKATWLFTKQLLHLVRNDRPHYLAVVMDGMRSGLKRRDIYPEYKKQRGEPSWDLLTQVRRIKQVIKKLGFRLIECQGYEADDAIATLAEKHACRDLEVNIVTRDKDLRQLCRNEDIFVLDPMENKFYSKLNAGDKWGIKTEQITEFLMLCGDSVDNVPGVAGFGEVTAAKCLNEHGSIRDLIIAATMGLLKPKLAENLVKAHHKGWLDISRKLITLDTSVDLNLKLADLKCNTPDFKTAGPLFRSLGFKRLEG